MSVSVLKKLNFKRRSKIVAKKSLTHVKYYREAQLIKTAYETSEGRLSCSRNIETEV